MGKGFQIDKRALQKMTREMQRELDKNPVSVDLSVQPSSSGSSGLTLSENSYTDFLAGLALDAWYEGADKRRGGSTVTAEALLAGYSDHLDITSDNFSEVTSLLEAKGMARTFGGFGARSEQPMLLLDSAQQEAVNRKQARSDILSKQVACRQALLRVLYDTHSTGTSYADALLLSSPRGWFFGVLYSAQEIERAKSFLTDKKLANDDAEAVRISQAGIECIENFSSISSFLSQRSTGMVNVTIQGNNNGQLAVANRDVEQTQNASTDTQVLTVFATALREFASLLPQGEGQEYEDIAASLEREAGKDEPDEGWVQALVDRAKNLLSKAEKFKGLAQVANLGFQLYKATHTGDAIPPSISG